jgi:hypothetical protein
MPPALRPWSNAGMDKSTDRAGITNRPPPREDAEQHELPPRGTAKDESARRSKRDDEPRREG